MYEHGDKYLIMKLSFAGWNKFLFSSFKKNNNSNKFWCIHLIWLRRPAHHKGNTLKKIVCKFFCTHWSDFSVLQVNKRKLYIILHWIHLQYSGTKFWFYTIAISTGFHRISTKHKEIRTTHFLHRLSIFSGMYKYYFVSLLRLKLILLKYIHLLFF